MQIENEKILLTPNDARHIIRGSRESSDEELSHGVQSYLKKALLERGINDPMSPEFSALSDQHIIELPFHRKHADRLNSALAIGRLMSDLLEHNLRVADAYAPSQPVHTRDAYGRPLLQLIETNA